MVYIGVDLHRKRSQLAAMDEAGALLFNRSIASESRAFLRVFGELAPEPIQVAFEATIGWGWFADLLADAGVEAHMAHPLATRAIATARVKNDAVDARTLAHLLRTHLLPEAWIAPLELGLTSIAEVGRERIRRAADKLGRDFENGDGQGAGTSGFRAFRLSSSNFEIWDPEVSDPEQLVLRLRSYADNLVDGRTVEDVLFELLLKLGAPLTTSPVAMESASPNVWLVPELATILCLAPEIDADGIEQLMGMTADRVLCLDGAFTGRDDLKTNAVLQARDRGIHFMTV